MNNYLKILKNIGLNDTQAEVYLLLLRIGNSTMTELSRKSRVKRPTLYDNIQVLMDLGLVIKVFEGGKKYYSADSPDRLINIITQKQSLVQSVLPELLKMHSYSSQNATIQFFDGKRGAEKVHEMALKYHKYYKTYFIGSVINSLFDVLTEEQVADYVSKRIKKGIWNYIISTDDISKMSHIYNKQRNKECLRELKVINSLGVLSVDLFVFGEYVSIASSAKDNYVILVHSNDFSNTIKNIFNVLWSIKE